jgi:hypothetical protein
MRLRRWLTNGFHFFLKELSRRLAEEAREGKGGRDLDPLDPFQADRVIDRTFAECVVEEARRKTRDALEAEGKGSHWRVLEGHYYENLSYRALAEEIGVTENHARTNMAPVARDRFRKILRELIARDGALESEIDEEIHSLLEALHS